MKKLLITGLLACLAVPSFAQLFTLGPKIGVNYSRLAIDETIGEYQLETDGRKPGFVAGAFAQLNLGPIVLQPEFLYSQERSVLAIDRADNHADATVSVNKLSMPLLAGFNLGRVVRLQAGPVMSKLLSAKLADAPSDIDLQSVKGKAWGFALGVGLDIGRIALDLRYEGVAKKRQLELVSDAAVHTLDYGRSNFQATIGFMLIK